MGAPAGAFQEDQTYWTSLAGSLEMPSAMLVDGAEVRTGHSLPVISPRDGRTIVEVAVASDADVDQAVSSARAAFDDGPWPRLAPRERAAAMLRWADLIERDRDALAVTIALEMGKPVREAWVIELRALLTTIRFYAELADKDAGEIPAVGSDDLALVTREPSGVVAAVVPWNFPLTLAGWKIAPALSVGCTVVVKPSELSPLSALRVARLALEAGIPPGVLNVVNGTGITAGRALGMHDGVDVLAFTGSTEVGRHFLRYSADSNLKRVWLELGGKSPNIVFADAPDLDTAAQAAAWGICFNSGQMCTAASRLLVQRSIAEEFTERVLDQVGSWTAGDPLDPATRLGPVVSEDQLTRVLGHVARAQDEGARLRTGGERVLGDTGGSFVSPAVLDHVEPASELAQREVFGPVLAVLPFDDHDDAVRLARDTEYGLAAAVWTSDLRTAHRVSQAVPAGTVWVNCYEEGDLTVPFGGMKASGNGRDKSRHAVDKYTELKTTWINLR
jgi:gamma-glutamyl-gamma-aminobutyraldehyde dehydrogenase